MEIEDEPTLRMHIRKLLLRYSLTHLTTNYVTYTRSKVSEILSECLATVPVEDPTTLTLPLEPFDILSRNLRLKELISYDQKWKYSAESTAFIKAALLEGSGKSRTERCWEADSDDTFYINADIPMSPVLTTRAIRQTPRLASRPPSPPLLKESYPRFMDGANIKVVLSEPIIEADISALERDNLLGLRPKIDPETHREISSIIRRIPAAQPHPRNSTRAFAAPETSMVSAFLRGTNTPPLKNLDYPLSPPIFPRRLSDFDPQRLEKLSDISTLNLVTKVKMEEEQEDMSAAHMLVVDGWNVLAPPPTSQGASSDTPSLEHGSRSSPADIDELFALTPPQIVTGNKMGAFLFFARKFPYLTTHCILDEYLIARSRKPRGGRRKKPAAQSLSTFLPSLIPVAPSHPVEDRPRASLNRSPPISESMIGLPPSPPNSSTAISSTKEGEQCPPMCLGMGGAPHQDAGLDSFIAELCRSVKGQSAEDLILKERIDENEALMMDVPKLVEPNEHPPSPSCPTMPASLRSLIAPVKPSDKTLSSFDCKPTVSCFKKVSGLQSLNIDLTWRPFNFGTSVPRTEELADVERLPALEPETMHEPDHAEAQLERLLNDLKITNDGKENGLDIFADPPVDWKVILGDTPSTGEVILTRAERKRLAGNGADDSDASGITEVHANVVLMSENRTQSAVPSRSHKRRKMDLQAASEASHFSGMPDALDLEPPAVPDVALLSSNAQQSLEPSGAAQLSPQDIPIFMDTEECFNDEREDSLDLADAPMDWNDPPVENTQLVPSEFENEPWNPDALEIVAGLFSASPLSQYTQAPAHPKSARIHPPKSFPINAHAFCTKQSHHPIPSKSLSEFVDGPPNPDAPEIAAEAFSECPLSPSAQVPAHSQYACTHPPNPPSVRAHTDFERQRTATLHGPSSNVARAARASARQTLSDFMQLRGKRHEPPAVHSSSPREPSQITPHPSSPRGFPSELNDSDTLTIPEVWSSPRTRHRYIASLELIQKRVIIKHLTAAACNVDLVERETHGVDLITDTDTALLFVPLAPLPATCEALSAKLALLSWDYARLVVVFECFSSSLSYRPRKNDAGADDLEPNPYSPPVVKAVRRLKRLLKISEGMETSRKREETGVWYAYAKDPGEAAKFARIVGDAPVSSSAGGAHEDAREWLADDYIESEEDLTQVRGMNAFAASMLLHCVDINTLIEMAPHERLEAFSGMVGEQRMIALNEEIANRLAAVACLSSPPRSPDAESAVASYVKPREGTVYEGGLYSEERMIGDSSGRDDGLHEDVMDWQTTGLLMVQPGKRARDAFEN